MCRRKNAVIAYGAGASFFGNPLVSENLRGPSTPAKKFLAAAQKHHLCKKVVMVDEYLTLQICPSCKRRRYDVMNLLYST